MKSRLRSLELESAIRACGHLAEGQSTLRSPAISETCQKRSTSGLELMPDGLIMDLNVRLPLGEIVFGIKKNLLR